MDKCALCGSETFGFHVCNQRDLCAVVAWQDKRIARLESKLKQAKKKRRK